MKALSRQMETARKADQHSITTRLHAPWLVLARGLWVALVAFDVIGSIMSFPTFVVYLRQKCMKQPCLSAQLTPESANVLQHLGLSVDSYSTLFLIFTILLAITSFEDAVVIYWRRSHNWKA